MRHRQQCISLWIVLQRERFDEFLVNACVPQWLRRVSCEVTLKRAQKFRRKVVCRRFAQRGGVESGILRILAIAQRDVNLLGQMPKHARYLLRIDVISHQCPFLIVSSTPLCRRKPQPNGRKIGDMGVTPHVVVRGSRRVRFTNWNRHMICVAARRLNEFSIIIGLEVEAHNAQLFSYHNFREEQKCPNRGNFYPCRWKKWLVPCYSQEPRSS